MSDQLEPIPVTLHGPAPVTRYRSVYETRTLTPDRPTAILGGTGREGFQLVALDDDIELASTESDALAGTGAVIAAGQPAIYIRESEPVAIAVRSFAGLTSRVTVISTYRVTE